MFCWKTALDPRAPSAFKCECVCIAELAKLERHTGARGFVLSGAIDDDDLTSARWDDRVHRFEEVHGLDAHRTRDLLIIWFAPDIEDDDIFLLVQPRFEVSDGHARSAVELSVGVIIHTLLVTRRGRT